MKIIKHLYSDSSDYLLCGHSDDQIGDNGEILDIDFETVIESYEDLFVKKKWNTNCKDCQNAVKNVLEQIKKK